MEVRAVAKYVKVQPRKVRIIADEVRAMNATFATHKLRFHTSKGAHELRKVLVSAMANAVENHQLDPDLLSIQAITVDEGPRQKRMRARAQGRGNRILKKTSHITVVVAEAEPAAAIKPHGTKAKARPTFAAPKSAGKPKTAKPTEDAIVAAEPEVTAEPTPVEAMTEVEAPEMAIAQDAAASEVVSEEAASNVAATEPEIVAEESSTPEAEAAPAPTEEEKPAN